jgi:hypothetical protein
LTGTRGRVVASAVTLTTLTRGTYQVLLVDGLSSSKTSLSATRAEPVSGL